jgi:hypothetical protein
MYVLNSLFIVINLLLHSFHCVSPFIVLFTCFESLICLGLFCLSSWLGHSTNEQGSSLESQSTTWNTLRMNFTNEAGATINLRGLLLMLKEITTPHPCVQNLLHRLNITACECSHSCLYNANHSEFKQNPWETNSWEITQVLRSFLWIWRQGQIEMTGGCPLLW